MEKLGVSEGETEELEVLEGEMEELEVFEGETGELGVSEGEMEELGAFEGETEELEVLEGELEELGETVEVPEEDTDELGVGAALSVVLGFLRTKEALDCPPKESTATKENESLSG
jgi:hypothetical protein